ncbi:MAG: hypothetical protein MJK14_18960, partial [Rivularia sp. ALOHA_DT_140]|nr:hypothetical protein [Rivularia sp. ALOHA_DT_140]
SNYKGSGKRKIMRNDCQHHETQMGIRLESWELDPKWVLYSSQFQCQRFCDWERPRKCCCSCN